MTSALGDETQLEQYFAECDPHSRSIFEALCRAIESIGPADMRVTKSQIAFRHGRGFAWAWVPSKYLRGDVAPLVLTISLDRRDKSPRWKEVVEPRAGRFTHHLELRAAEDVDREVVHWLREAWRAAS